MIRWEVGMACHIGGQSEQEDRAGVWESPDLGQFLLVVADGMGGHSGGAEAARSVIDSAETLWRCHRREGLSPRALLHTLFERAHEAIRQLGEGKVRAPHSTCVALHLGGGKATWAHLGDSRLYHFNKGKLFGRTRDHSVVQLLVDMNQVREEEMGFHPDQKKLLKSLGSQEPPDPEFGEAELTLKTAFALCTDGVWGGLPPKRLAGALKRPRLNQESARLVEQLAREGG